MTPDELNTVNEALAEAAAEAKAAALEDRPPVFETRDGAPDKSFGVIKMSDGRSIYLTTEAEALLLSKVNTLNYAGERAFTNWRKAVWLNRVLVVALVAVCIGWWV